VNATEPAAKTTRGLILVARERSRRASLSVNSATKIAVIIVTRALNNAKVSGNYMHLF